MAIRTNTNPTPLALPPELLHILARNGMRAQVMGSSNGFVLVVQGHDSPVLTYPITQKQLQALTDWGTNYSNKRSYNTFASIVAADFDMPRDFVHARNANGRVAMGLHGYRIGVGEYGRMGHHHHHPSLRDCFWGRGFLGWTPRIQDGFHMRRINGGLYYPGAPMVPNRPDGRIKPGELQNGGYGFYYKGQQSYNAQTPSVQQTQQQDVLKDLQTVITPQTQQPRQTEPAKPYNTLVTSDVYFSNEKWQECLESHGIVIGEESKTMTIQSSATEVNFVYDLTDEEFKSLTNNSLTESPLNSRIDLINGLISSDFKDAVTMETLNSDKQIELALNPAVLTEIDKQMQQQLGSSEDATQAREQDKERGQQMGSSEDATKGQQQTGSSEDVIQETSMSRGGVLMDGRDLGYIDENKGWYREGRHGREVDVSEIRVEPTAQEGKYKMSAVIDGNVVSHEITQKQYDKFVNLDDYHRMKLFAKVFPEVDIKSHGDGIGVGAKISAALMAGLAVAHEVAHHHHHMAPDIYMDHHHGPMPHAYFKPGVDTPMDVAARNFEAAVVTEAMHNEIRHGR